MNAKPNPAQRQRSKTTEVTRMLIKHIIIFFFFLLNGELVVSVSLTVLHYFSNRHIVDIRHVTQDRKYGKTCEHTGT